MTAFRIIFALTVVIAITLAALPAILPILLR